eukprot:6106758-Karenia_brevis.AAC.1
MHHRGKGSQGSHAMLRRLYIDNKKFITHTGKGFTLGNWVRAVEQGRTVPKSEEVLQILKDMNKKFTQEQLAVIEAGLGWAPMVLGDGHVVGSLVQKY